MKLLAATLVFSVFGSMLRLTAQTENREAVTLVAHGGPVGLTNNRRTTSRLFVENSIVIALPQSTGATGSALRRSAVPVDHSNSRLSGDDGGDTMIVKHSKRTVRKPCTRCGRKDLYWGHDTAVAGRDCDACDVTGKWLLIEVIGAELVPHVLSCSGKGAHDDTPTEEEETVPTPPAVSVPVATPAGTDVAYTAFQAMMGAITPQLDRGEIVALIREELAGVTFPTRTVIQRVDGTVKTLDGNTHVKVADVITDLMAGEHVMMVGPAGTGKSTIASQSAEALGVAYYSISLSPMTPASQILGYMQAEGEYVRSLYREAYEHGGVFHFDEIDNAHPSVLAVVNASLANGSMAFPDGMVKRHDDFRCVASANTYGKGADRAYVGRQAIDAATLDRFSIETIEIDEALERVLCMSTGLAENVVDDVLRFVRKLRANADAKRMTVVLSPRASVGMCRLLAAGRGWNAAVEARVRRGMSDADWSKLGSV